MTAVATTLIAASGFLPMTGTAAFLAIVAHTSVEERTLADRFGDA